MSATAISRRAFDPAATAEILAFVAAHATSGHDPALRRLLLCELPRSAEHVVDLFCEGERVLVASVIDTVDNAPNAAILELLAWRVDATSSLDAFATALDLAEELTAPGPRRCIETPIYPPLTAAIPLLEARGHSLAFCCYEMQTQGAAILVEAPPLPAGWRWIDVGLAEVGAYRRLLKAAFARVPGANVGDIEQLRVLVETSPLAPRMLLDAAGAPAGVARFSLAPDGLLGVVDSIARDPRRRGEGLGVWLMVESLSGLRARGARRYALSVAAENRAALILYERFGFEVRRVEPSYHSQAIAGRG